MSKRLRLALLTALAACHVDKRFDDDGSDDPNTGADDAPGTGAGDAPDTGTDTEGSEDICGPTDPMTRVELTVDIGTFPVDPPPEEPTAYRIEDAPCAVTAVSTDAALVHTELSCTAPDSTAHVVTIAHAITDLGTPTWAAGDMVQLSIDDYVWSDLNDIRLVNASMRDADGRLMFFAADTNDRGFDDVIAAPLVISLDEDGCAAGEEGAPARGRLTFTLSGVALEVGDGRDGLLVSTDGVWAIEVAAALTGDFGETAQQLEVLVVAVDPA